MSASGSSRRTLAGQNIGALPGRDLLSRAVFVYAGYAGQCTISF